MKRILLTVVFLFLSFGIGSAFLDPETGRFITADPVEGDVYEPRSLQRYSYAFNNPFKYVDPDGERVILQKFSNNEENTFLDELFEITGLRFVISGNSELLFPQNVNSIKSQTAFDILFDAIDDKNVFYRVRSTPNDRRVRFGKSNPTANLVEIDFEDYSKIEYGYKYPHKRFWYNVFHKGTKPQYEERIPKLTYSVGIIFLHELYHCVSKLPDKDPVTGTYLKGLGPVVIKMNLIRRELNLPARSRYEATRDPRDSSKIRTWFYIDGRMRYVKNPEYP